MTSVLKASKDSVTGAVKIQDKIVGRVKAVTETIDNSPIAYEAIDTRTVKNYSGQLKVSAKLDKNHNITIEPNLFELATGRQIRKTDGTVLITPDDELSSYYSIRQYDDNAEHAVYGLRKAAQSFFARGDKIERMTVVLKKVQGATPADKSCYISIQGDSAGAPDGIDLSGSQKAIADASIGTTDTIIEIDYSDSPVVVTTGTKYWLVVVLQANVGAADDYLAVRYNSLKDKFTDGTTAYYDGTWSDVNYDLSFTIEFLTPTGLEIELITENGSMRERTVLKNVKFTANEYSVTPTEIIVDSGSVEAETIEVKLETI